MRRRRGRKVRTLTRGESVGTPCPHGKRTRNEYVERQTSAEAIVLPFSRREGRAEFNYEHFACAYRCFVETENKTSPRDDAMNGRGT